MVDEHLVQWIMPAKIMAQNYNQFLKVMVRSRLLRINTVLFIGLWKPNYYIYVCVCFNLLNYLVTNWRQYLFQSICNIHKWTHPILLIYPLFSYKCEFFLRQYRTTTDRPALFTESQTVCLVDIQMSSEKIAVCRELLAYEPIIVLLVFFPQASKMGVANMTYGSEHWQLLHTCAWPWFW